MLVEPQIIWLRMILRNPYRRAASRKKVQLAKPKGTPASGRSAPSLLSIRSSVCTERSGVSRHRRSQYTKS